jgi:glycosyltransferase involved in cell wall biosynthesis
MLARLGETWVITRANNRDRIEKSLKTIPERDRLRFVYVDLPSWARFWKSGKWGARPYYVLWQVAALLKARKLDKRISFDVSWHLTMSTAWLGSLAPMVGRKFIMGPVGGGVRMPWRLVAAVGPKGAAFEALRSAAQMWGRYLNPMARLAWHRADLILVQNPDTYKWLPKSCSGKTHVFPHVVLEERPVKAAHSTSGSPTALFAGRLLPWKGLALSIRALAQKPEWRLVVCGSGPDARRLQRLATREGVDGRIDWRGWQKRGAVMEAMREASVFLFPSLHDEGGWVVVESFANGLPVICLNIGGPAVLGGEAIEAGTLRETVGRLASALDGAPHLPVKMQVPDIDEATERLAGLVPFEG